MECGECLSHIPDGSALDEGTLVIGYSDRTDASCLASELSERGLDVIALDFTAHVELGGSVGSSVLPLERAAKNLKTRKKSKAGMAEM